MSQHKCVNSHIMNIFDLSLTAFITIYISPANHFYFVLFYIKLQLSNRVRLLLSNPDSLCEVITFSLMDLSMLKGGSVYNLNRDNDTIFCIYMKSDC